MPSVGAEEVSLGEVSDDVSMLSVNVGASVVSSVVSKLVSSVVSSVVSAVSAGVD